MVTCPNCGTDVAQTDEFCRQCGTPLGDRLGAPTGETGGQEPPQQPPEDEGTRRPGQHGRADGPDRPQQPGQAGAAGPGDRPPGQPPEEGRRDVVKYGLAVAGLAAVGWLLFGKGSESADGPLSLGGEVRQNPQVAVTISEETDENGNPIITVQIDAIQHADSIAIQCSDNSSWREIDDPQVGQQFTCGPDELDDRGQVLVRATYEGNTIIIQEYEYDFS